MQLYWSICSNFGENSLSKCASQPDIVTNSLKTPISGFQGRSRSSMLVPPERSSAVFVMISSKSVSICDRSQARWVDSSRNSVFWRSTQIWCPSAEDSLNLGGGVETCITAERNVALQTCREVVFLSHGFVYTAKETTKKSFTAVLSRFVRPPGTVVPGGLSFTADVFFSVFLSARSQSSVGRSPRNCHVIGSKFRLII